MSSESDDSCDNKPAKWRSADVRTVENVEFSSLLLSDPILQGLKNCGFEKPSPVQLQAIPLGRCGLDLVVQAKSGTGKTCVLAVIALDNLIVDSQSTQVLILAPTREIASQICGVVTSLGCAFPGLTCETFIGGLPLSADKAKLPNCQVVVGTPGRVKQLIDMDHLQTDSVRLFVVDEADRLFDKQFKEDINWIFSSLPSRKQILALSATYPEELSNFLALYMENPVFVRINSKDPALLGITQYFCSTPFHPLPQVTDSAKFDVLLDILNCVTFSQCMVFCQRQTKAQDLADNLVLKGFPTLGICSALDQIRRLEIIRDLKSFQCRVLVSTDLTARGIDAENVNLVINFDVPYEGEVYLHRIGRAGRYGTRGMAISLASAGDEIKRLKSFQKKFLFKIYQLPDPIPSDLWDMSLALAPSLPEEQESRQNSAETGVSISTNGACGFTLPKNSVAEEQVVQPVEVNHSTKFPESFGDTAKNNDATVLNGDHENCSHPSSSSEVSKAPRNSEDELSNAEKKTEKISESENPGTSITEDETGLKKQSEHELPTQIENTEDVELKIDDDDVKDSPVVCSIIVQRTEQIIRILDENESNSVLKVNTTSLTPYLLNVSSDLSKAEGINSSLSENQGEASLSDECGVFDPVKHDNTEYNCDGGTANSKGKAVSFKIDSLFPNWEKHMNSNETFDFSDEEMSNILLPLLSSNKTKYCRSDLSYNKLVDVLEPYKEGIANNEHDSECYFPGSTSITTAQLEALQKSILHDRSEVLSRVQKKFSELRADLIPCQTDEVGSEPLSRSSVDDKDPDSSVPDNDMLLQSSIISPNDNALSSGAAVELDQAATELRVNAQVSDSLVLETGDKNSGEIKSALPESESIDGESVKADTCKEPNTILPGVPAEPPLKADSSPKEQPCPVSINKSVGFVKDKATAPRNDARINRKPYNLTEADFDSASRGLKHCRIVPLPLGPSDSLKNDSLLNAKDAGSAHSSSQKPKVKYQSTRKKVENERHGTFQKAEKPKLKGNSLHSTKNFSSRSSFSDKNGLMAKEDALSSSSQETETQYRPRKGASGHASTSHYVEQNADYRKREKVKSVERKSKLNFPKNHGKKFNSDKVDQNPVNVNFINGMNDINNSGFQEATYTPFYPQNRSSRATGTEHASRPPQNHGIYSCCVKMPHDNGSVPQYDCCCRPRSTPQYGCCCRPLYTLPNECCSQPPIPFHDTYPQYYYYQKYLELWYYMQELTYGYRHH